MASITTDGFSAIEHALAEFPKKFRNKAVRTTMRDGMKQIVLRDAQRTIPVDEGQLRKSLKVRAAKGKSNKRLPRGVIGSQVVVAKTTKLDAYYGSFVLLGTKFRTGTRTLRNALYRNAKVLQAFVIGSLKSKLPAIAREVKLDSLRYKG